MNFFEFQFIWTESPHVQILTATLHPVCLLNLCFFNLIQIQEYFQFNSERYTTLVASMETMINNSAQQQRSFSSVKERQPN